jgi:nicotinamidase-related amidase
VIIVQDIEVGAGPGSPEFTLLDELEVSESDVIVHKSYCNAFWQTELDRILKEKDTGFLVISGFAAEHCILFTYNGARERGYNAVLLQHGIAGYDMNEVKAIQLLRPVISCQALEYFLKSCD